MDVIVAVGVDAAGMAFTARLEDLPHLVERLIEPVILEDRQDRAELLGRESVLPAYLLLFDNEKRLVVGDREPGKVGDDRCGPRDGVRRAVPAGVPAGLLERRLLPTGHDVTAFRLQLLQESLVD